MYRFYHNPDCSKSRAALKFLQKKSTEIELIKYLEQPLSKVDFLRILSKLTIEKHLLIRTSDKAYQDLGICDVTTLTHAEIAKLLATQPALMQRPILETKTRAAIARPLENMFAIM